MRRAPSGARLCFTSWPARPRTVRNTTQSRNLLSRIPDISESSTDPRAAQQAWESGSHFQTAAFFRISFVAAEQEQQQESPMTVTRKLALPCQEKGVPDREPEGRLEVRLAPTTLQELLPLRP